MKTIPIQDDQLSSVVTALAKSEVFGEIEKSSLQEIAQRAKLIQYEPDEIIFEESTPADSFLMIVKGEVAVLHHHMSSDEVEEMGRMGPYEIIGEVGLLLDMNRTARVSAAEKTLVLQFDKALFASLFESMPAFSLAVGKSLARRLQGASSYIPLPSYDVHEKPPSQEALNMLPVGFMVRHRVIPVELDGNVFRVGFVNDPTPNTLNALRRFAPGMELRMVHIENAMFDEVLRSKSGLADWQAPSEGEAGEEGAAEPVVYKSPRLDGLLQRVVEEGASDLHLAAGHPPYWRIDGELRVIEDTAVLSEEEALELTAPGMSDAKQEELKTNLDADFIYVLEGLARFRVNMYRDERGISAAFRFIPSQILTFEQLGLPPVLKKLCSYPKGLVLVTGPTGSGKSTTLAAMIDYINRTRRNHIITMEDPIEFLHVSDQSLINQREIGRHALGYAHALRAALREDPDIILVGEMRDRETMALALETANTGHLVFGTLHTATAISTMTRLIDAFPSDQQNQIRTSLADSLRGVVAQALCRTVGGGRTAALEILVVNVAVSNLIREEKYNQIASYMQTGKDAGNRLLNQELEKLVRRRKVQKEEALSKTTDKDDLRKRLSAPAAS